jgi:hypothetical protein
MSVCKEVNLIMTSDFSNQYVWILLRRRRCKQDKGSKRKG